MGLFDSLKGLGKSVTDAVNQIGEGLSRMAREAAAKRAAARASWQQAAEARGLLFSPHRGAIGRIDGTFGDRRVVAYEEVIRSDDRTRRETLVETELPDLRLGLKIQEEGLGADILRTFGAKPLPTGDQSFDARFMVRGRDTALTLSILTPAVRQAIASIDDLGRANVTVLDTCIRWRRRGREHDGVLIGAVIDAQRRAADELLAACAATLS